MGPLVVEAELMVSETIDRCLPRNSADDCTNLVFQRDVLIAGTLEHKPDHFLDNQGRKVNVVFGGVLNATAIVNSDILWSEIIVVDVTLNVVVGIALVCEHLEEYCVSGFQATQHD